jgi:HSP20 family protein
MATQQTGNGTTLATRPENAPTRWNPWQELAEMRRQVDDLFGRSFGYPAFPQLLPNFSQEEEPEVDIHETETSFQVLASLPGYTPEQIQVEATEDTISIRGERPALVETEKAKTHRNSGVSSSSQFQIAYTLPQEINPNKITATFKNGVLQLELPKSEQAKAQHVKVAVQAGK